MRTRSRNSVRRGFPEFSILSEIVCLDERMASSGGSNFSSSYSICELQDHSLPASALTARMYLDFRDLRRVAVISDQTGAAYATVGHRICLINNFRRCAPRWWILTMGYNDLTVVMIRPLATWIWWFQFALRSNQTPRYFTASEIGTARPSMNNCLFVMRFFSYLVEWSYVWSCSSWFLCAIGRSTRWCDCRLWLNWW